MDQSSLEKNFIFEEDYWWFLGRRRIVRTLIERFFKKSAPRHALDAGCGTGIVLNDLKAYAHPIGIDRSQTALAYARKREHGGNLCCGDLCSLPFQQGSFDLITVLGVLYNKGIGSDDKAVEEASRVLKKGGLLIIDEAAYSFLQSRHNKEVGGVRRYTRSQLVNKLKAHGFKIVKASYWDMLMLPLFYLIVQLENFSHGRRRYSKLSKISKVFNTLLTGYLYLEARLMKYINLPFGPSVIIAGQKQ